MKKTYGNFTFTYTDGPVIIEPRVFHDERGCFMETYNEEAFKLALLPYSFAQDNHSISKKGVLRGMHGQHPHTQGKLVRVVKGKVYDVGIDVRPGSKTFGQKFEFILDAESKKMVYFPGSFLHGFLALEDSEFVYKCTDPYFKGEDITVNYADPDLGIDWDSAKKEMPIVTRTTDGGNYVERWHLTAPRENIVSEKDKKGISFQEYLKRFPCN